MYFLLSRSWWSLNNSRFLDYIPFSNEQVLLHTLSRHLSTSRTVAASRTSNLGTRYVIPLSVALKVYNIINELFIELGINSIECVSVSDFAQLLNLNLSPDLFVVIVGTHRND